MPKLIDAMGQSCPIPVLMAKAAIAAGEDTFTVLVDNQTSVENLKRLAASQGFSAGVQGGEGRFSLDFSRSGQAVLPQETPVPATAPTGAYAVFVGRDIIGSGDRELGTNLIRMFFYTLAASDQLPAAILFMNDGVKLPALDSQVIDHLNTLCAKGVDVLVCGTCLNFYGLADRLGVGTASNMYDILSRMQAAAKVITL